MDREDIRLECVKLAYAHGRDAAEAVGRAKVLEEYVTSLPQPSQVKVTSVPPKKRPGRPRKKADNPDFLS